MWRLLTKTTRSSKRIDHGRGHAADRFADESYHVMTARASARTAKGPAGVGRDGSRLILGEDSAIGRARSEFPPEHLKTIGSERISRKVRNVGYNLADFRRSLHTVGTHVALTSRVTSLWKGCN